MNKITLTAEKGRTQVLCGGEPLFCARTAIVRDYGVRDGDVLDDAQVEAFRVHCLLREGLLRANELLSRRDYSAAALTEKLGGGEIAETVVARLIEKGLVDDEKYARLRAEHLLQNRLYSRDRTVYALIGEGIDRDLARRVTEENDSGEERLARLIERKYRRKLAEPDGVRKVTQALLRLGFGTDEVRGALRAFTGQD